TCESHCVPSQLARPAHSTLPTWKTSNPGRPAMYSRSFQTARVSHPYSSAVRQPVCNASHDSPFHIARLAVPGRPPALENEPDTTSRSPRPSPGSNGTMLQTLTSPQTDSSPGTGAH